MNDSHLPAIDSVSRLYFLMSLSRTGFFPSVPTMIAGFFGVFTLTGRLPVMLSMSDDNKFAAIFTTSKSLSL